MGLGEVSGCADERVRISSDGFSCQCAYLSREVSGRRFPMKSQVLSPLGHGIMLKNPTRRNTGRSSVICSGHYSLPESDLQQEPMLTSLEMWRTTMHISAASHKGTNERTKERTITNPWCKLCHGLATAHLPLLPSPLAESERKANRMNGVIAR